MYVTDSGVEWTGGGTKRPSPTLSTMCGSEARARMLASCRAMAASASAPSAPPGASA
jgi:hypothetical protein